MRLAHLGPAGTWSEAAARHFRADAALVPAPTFAAVLQSLHLGHADAAVLPVENSRTGRVADANALLEANEYTTIGEINLAIHHALLTLADVTLADLKLVRSHPQALAQCAWFIAHELAHVQCEATTSTAAAIAAIGKERTAAAIAAPHACPAHLVILAPAIQDDPHNTTRFVIVTL